MSETPSSSDDRYFMAIALLSERRSKDLHRQVGACIVNEHDSVTGIGYNGMPLRYRDNDEDWQKNKQDNRSQNGPTQDDKHSYVCHAELNAVVNMDPVSSNGSTIYVTLFPCNECAKVLIRSGVKKVVYLSFDQSKQAKDAFKLSEALLEEHGVIPEQFKAPEKDKITWLFKEENNKAGGSEQKNERSKYKAGDKFLKKKSEGMTKKQIDEIDEFKKKFLPVVSWEQYFMGLAMLSRDMKSIPNKKGSKEGACVVNEDKRIVGLGYIQELLNKNGSDGGPSPSKDRKIPHDPSAVADHVLHAPVCAIVSKTPVSLRNCTMYVTQFPCKECAKVIVQCGITTVVYMEGEIIPAVEKMFDMARVKFMKYKYEAEQIPLDFSNNDKN